MVRGMTVCVACLFLREDRGLVAIVEPQDHRRAIAVAQKQQPQGRQEHEEVLRDALLQGERRERVAKTAENGAGDQENAPHGHARGLQDGQNLLSGPSKSTTGPGEHHPTAHDLRDRRGHKRSKT